ncbi:MAG TPA: hypothetical protein VKD69_21300 [Vicinamibacterales bacterium]|nr:hypothetical protein [Vicinamibacterales bacterium]
MRKRYRVLIFSALVAALVVPVGYALSVESAPGAAYPLHGVAPAGAAATVVPSTAAAAVSAPVLVPSSAPAAASSVYDVPDAAKLFGIGAVLFGLAAAVRKAI